MAWQGILVKISRILTPIIATRVVTKAGRVAQDRAEDYIAKKRREFVSHAKTEAEVFVAEQVVLIEQKVDAKIAEIERKIDEQIEKEVRSKLRILIFTLIAVVLMSLVSLGYLYFR